MIIELEDRLIRMNSADSRALNKIINDRDISLSQTGALLPALPSLKFLSNTNLDLIMRFNHIIDGDILAQGRDIFSQLQENFIEKPD